MPRLLTPDNVRGGGGPLTVLRCSTHVFDPVPVVPSLPGVSTSESGGLCAPPESPEAGRLVVQPGIEPGRAAYETADWPFVTRTGEIPTLRMVMHQGEIAPLSL